jgi:hypothetical protein
MKTFFYLWNMLIAPRRTSQALVDESRVRYAAALVLSYGLFNSLGFLLSALRHDYPPPPVRWSCGSKPGASSPCCRS